MKILHVVHLLSPGGIEQFVLTLLKADFDNTYILALEGTIDKAIDTWPVLAQYKSHLIFADISSIGKRNTIRLLKKVCDTHEITVLHSHYTAPLIYACLSSLGKKHRVHVHTEHDAWHLSSWKYWLFERIAFTLNRKIQLVAVSNQIQSLLHYYFPFKTTSLIHNAVDTELYKPGERALARKHFNLSESAIIIGSVGRLNEIKGHEYLIKAMQYLPDNIHLAIAGDGPLYQELLILIDQYRLNHRVHLLGLVTQTSLYYQACDLFCLPSLQEGLPLALLEAQSSNLPAVCSDVGSCSEGVDPSSGVLVRPSDPEALAQGCLYVIEKKGNPRDFILKNFSLKILQERYINLYRGR